MGVLINKDGSITVGILEPKRLTEAPKKEEAPAKKPKTTAKKKAE